MTYTWIIERGAEVRPGQWAWCAAAADLSGVSRQPLLDACRAIKTLGGDTGRQRAAIYRAGRNEADISCLVDIGAGLTVKEDDKGIRFRKYQPFSWGRGND